MHELMINARDFPTAYIPDSFAPKDMPLEREESAIRQVVLPAPPRVMKQIELLGSGPEWQPVVLRPLPEIREIEGFAVKGDADPAIGEEPIQHTNQAPFLGVIARQQLNHFEPPAALDEHPGKKERGRREPGGLKIKENQAPSRSAIAPHPPKHTMCLGEPLGARAVRKVLLDNETPAVL